MTKLNFNFKTTYLNLSEKLFSKVLPSKVAAPKLLLWNDQLATELGIIKNEQGALAYLSGNQVVENSTPIAQAYAGHQFGHFNILGDGRAILLGEHITPQEKIVDVQLKGAGQTPYSRRGDGKATLYSMLREYLISEAMHHVGISSSRSLAVIARGEKLRRDTIQGGAVLTRVAASHIRVGTFEFARRALTIAEFKEFTSYAIERHYPELLGHENPPLAFFKKVMHVQISTVCNWLRVGFIHGVMNTDNTSISGETFDYGPCAFMNEYDPKTVFSSIDTQGRYAFGNQSRIILWNLARFAESLLPLFDSDETKALEKAQAAIDEFGKLYDEAYLKMMRKKLGWIGEEDDDVAIIQELLAWMQINNADYTNTFLYLESHLTKEEVSFDATVYQNGLDDILKNWKARCVQKVNSSADAIALMKENNPRIIPRNHLVEKALRTAEGGDFSFFNLFLKALQSPYDAAPLEFQLVPSDFDENYKTFCGT